MPPSRDLGLDPFVAQQGGHALAQLQPLLADDDRRAAGIVPAPAGDIAVVAVARAGNQPGIGGIVVIVAHVDDGGRIGQTDQAGKLGNGDFAWRRHMRPPSCLRLWDAIFGLTPHGVVAKHPMHKRMASPGR